MAKTMGIVLVAACLAACAGSQNYHRAYEPTEGTTKHERAKAVQKVVIAITDAGREVEESDATTGIVLSKWFSGDGFGQDQSRYRIRVVLDEASGYEIAALCQGKSSTSSAWNECEADDLRPQFVLDTMARVDEALR